ncbi:DUF397 domain-containing protein [Streptomyces sp. 4N509B]|uniref:DUF397 domain-containing protein n=1 Tax=Streptomyces sp. 4N509B TaxID=3457413 RepID=UPI003FD13051
MAIQQATTMCVWTRSSYSAGNGACVEVRAEMGERLAVRDSKAPAGPRLGFGARSWSAFVGFAGHADVEAVTRDV